MRGRGGSRGPLQPVAALFTAGRTDLSAAQSAAVVTDLSLGMSVGPPTHLLPPANTHWDKPLWGLLEPGGSAETTAPRPSVRTEVTVRLPSLHTQVLRMLNRSPRAKQMMSFPSWGRFRAGYLPPSQQHPAPPSTIFRDIPPPQHA